MLTASILQYYCRNCHNILKESKVRISKTIEPCPFCGTLLSDSLERKLPQRPRKSLSTTFQKASSIPKLALDIPQLDGILHFLSSDQKVCIAGVHTQKLVERLCIRAQLPYRYGGLNTTVLLVDGANSSDIYQCVDFAHQYGLDAKKTLRNIITSRCFTVYQLANLITTSLESTIKQYNAKLVVITNLLYFFSNDPYLDKKEMKMILKQVVKSIQNIKDCLVVVSLGKKTQYDDTVLKLFSKVIKIKQDHHKLSVQINDNGICNTIPLKKKDLETIPQH